MLPSKLWKEQFKTLNSWLWFCWKTIAYALTIGSRIGKSKQLFWIVIGLGEFAVRRATKAVVSTFGLLIDSNLLFVQNELVILSS